MFGENKNFYGTENVVKVKMQRAQLFATYDSVLNQLLVAEDTTTSEDIGVYKVRVEVTYLNPNGKEQFNSRSFYLHILPDPNASDGSGGPTDGDDSDSDSASAYDWNGQTLFEK